MNMVVDTNIFMSALIKESITREIIINSGCTFLFPEFEFEELMNHKKEILKKSKLSDFDFNILLLNLLKRVKVIGAKRIVHNKKKAFDIIGKIDEDDVQFIATALTFNCPIWSQDKHFKKQNKIKVFNTSEMIGIYERLV